MSKHHQNSIDCAVCHGDLHKSNSDIAKAQIWAPVICATCHEAPTVIEQKLFVMFLEHRMRSFQGAFHATPDYTFWYGWSEMQRDLTEI